MGNKKQGTMPGQLHCLRCGEDWWPEKPIEVYRPKCCPGCKSRKWDEPKEGKGHGPAHAVPAQSR